MRVGRAFVATKFRGLRKRQLLALEQVRLADTEPLARHVRVERALRSEVRALGLRVQDGEWELVPEFRRMQMVLYRHRLGRHRGDARVTRTAWLTRCAHVGCDGRTDEHGVCSACNQLTCQRCGADGTPPHVCDPTNLASVDAIRTSCRPCVRCHAPSVRVEGCPTMWCVQCQTFWNWDTGRVIETTRILPHNPDHREWLRAGGQVHMREVGDVPCGGLPDGTMLHTAMLRDMLVSLDVAPSTLVVVDAAEALHTAQTLRGDYPRTWVDADVHEWARVAHLLGDLDEEAFAQALDRTERTSHMRREVGLVLEALVLGGADVLQRMCAGGVGVEVTAVELRELRDVADAALMRVSQVHQRTVPRLSTRWQWTLPGQRRPPAPAA